MEKSRGTVRVVDSGDTPPPQYHGKASIVNRSGEVVNASGNKDQLRRQYGLLSICGLALTVDNAWTTLGISLATAICMRWNPKTKPLHLADILRRQWRWSRCSLRAARGWDIQLLHRRVSGRSR